ncbi:MAG: hypothetical protein IKE94_01200 [Aeriscardovia sp.]|nr:hypothetical protein [Aeriscardovia sp.]
MPYVFVEELQEDQEQADVIERTEFERVSDELEEMREQRDTAIERAEIAEKGWREAKQKYADTFLTTPAKIIENHNGDKSEPLTAQSIKELFARKDN